MLTPSVCALQVMRPKKKEHIQAVAAIRKRKDAAQQKVLNAKKTLAAKQAKQDAKQAQSTGTGWEGVWVR
jgi:hypothetical protein